MRNTLTFGSISSATYGVYINGKDTFGAPQKEVEFLTIPGRNGDLIRNGNRFTNIEVVYHAFIYNNFISNIRDFRNALNSVKGYAKLTDTYNSGEFRLAAYAAEFTPDVLPTLNAGEFDIVFNCKPQRFLTLGDYPITYTSSPISIYNAYRFPSNPKIEVNCPSGGECMLTIRDQIITINNPGGTLIIDSEMQDCYYGTANMNDKVAFSDYNFPVLNPGTNAITMDSGMTVAITPRWWRL